jgi:uncharacterized membrane protein YccC
MNDTSDDPFFMLRKLRNGSFGDWTYLRFRAADEIERLQRELAEAYKNIDLISDNYQTLSRELADAQQYQADAQRYRYLRGLESVLDVVHRDSYEHILCRQVLDAAIAAALRGEEK